MVGNLEEAVQRHRRRIATDAYPMSIGELANLYADGELNVHPEFQRIFRWTPSQRTRLIESIILGIPLPSIFVAATEEGWDVVDGVQRLSTIFSFMGVLKDDEGVTVDPFVCEAGPLLPELEGVVFDVALLGEPTGSGRSVKSFSATQRIDFKRSRIDLKIIKRESDKKAKLDLFQRLNSFGTHATDQELRNALLVSISPKHYKWLTTLAEEGVFKSCLSLAQRNLDEQDHVEIALRFVSLRSIEEDKLKGMGSLSDFLNTQLIDLTDLDDDALARERTVFMNTFEVLYASGGDKILRKWNPAENRPEGGFSATAFEVLALGVGFHDADPSLIDADIVDARRSELWADPQFAPGFSTGIRADQRMRKTIPYGRQLFSQD